ncbi:helix-turn-helix transcriptional regulator, partial [Dactylosporangium sp. NPDC049742]|uniref:helix-turn-helix transcriptional regulator n=1 Tax=Dactylosporangium sp. NPDC049742 TaxID=3154737 RepID=UPI00342EBC4B
AADDAPGALLTGLATWALDGPAAAVPALRRALDTIDPARDLDLLWLAVPAALEVSDVATAHRLSGAAAGAARAAGALSVLPVALTLHAGTLLLMGRSGEAADLLAECEGLAAATGVARHAAVGCGHASLTAFLTTAPAALLTTAPGAHPALGLRALELSEVVEAAVHANEPAVAADARDLLAAHAAATGTDWSLGALALADALTGPGEAADGRFREAATRLDAAGLGLLTARARLLHGEWLRREGRRADARTVLHAAHDTFAGMGLHALAERAARELAATGETVRKRSEGPSDELTAQEAQIARLAVAGRTNPEIGAALFLSPRTVEWHLRKVFGKLGITSRRELAAALVRP